MLQTSGDRPFDAFERKVELERGKHFPMNLPHGVRAVLESRDDVLAFSRKNRDLVFPGARPLRVDIPPERAESLQDLAAHSAKLYSENILFYDGATPIGWSYGECQDSVVII